MRILIVEDNEDARLFLSEYLTAQGFETLEAADLTSACAIIQDIKMKGEEIDAVVSDLDLPSPNEGVQVLEFAKEHLPNALRILMSGRHDNLFKKAHSVRAGFLPKPFQTKELMDLIKISAGSSRLAVWN